MRPVRVGETLVLHAADLLRWRDGTSAADPNDATAMRLLNWPVRVAFDAPPADLAWLHKPGQTALWRRPTQDIVHGLATDADRQRPGPTPFALQGTVVDATGAFQPRRFSLMAGSAQGHDLVLYPSTQGTRFGSGGGLTGSLRFDLLAQHLPDPDAEPTPEPFLLDPRRPAAWALIEVAVTVGDGDLRRFRAQAGPLGDFRLSLWRLPPLPAGTAAYAAELSVRAALTALDRAPLDPTALAEMSVASLPPAPDPTAAPPTLPADAFGPTLALSLVPGAVQRVPTAAPHRLALRPAP
jgi:hypothetical protein